MTIFHKAEKEVAQMLIENLLIKFKTTEAYPRVAGKPVSSPNEETGKVAEAASTRNGTTNALGRVLANFGRKRTIVVGGGERTTP